MLKEQPRLHPVCQGVSEYTIPTKGIYYDTTKNSPGYTGSVKRVFYQGWKKHIIFIAVSPEGTLWFLLSRRFYKRNNCTNIMIMHN